MTNLRWLQWHVTRYYRNQGLQVRIRSIRLGNTAIDGEVIGNGYRIALEIKTPSDDVTRALGQLTEALAYGYDRAALVTTLSKAKRINRKVFDRAGFLLFAVDSKGIMSNLTPGSNQERITTDTYSKHMMVSVTKNGCKR